ncbi:Beta-galactosidase 10 [Linum perenne]
MEKLSHFLLFFFSCLLISFFEVGSAGNVTYDGRSLLIDGQRKLFISASIHYPRSVPAMWPGLVQTAKEGGVDVIETYVFWNGHEISPSVYNFEGRYDLVKFVKIVQNAGMHLILRIGPFVAAEWNYGGVPVWLHYIPGTVFRTDNENFKFYMQRFMTYIVNLMKKEKLFASQGGPIILAQVENEYGYYEQFYGEGGKRYAMWSAQMAVAQNIGVPWIMCQQFDAPDPVIDTCNGFYCDAFKPISPHRPKIWTENWPGWFQLFGAPNPHRPAEDVAYAVARFFQKGGTVNNYYMYHGGTNFGRTAGGPFITTSYDYEAPIDEYGMPNQPKWGHLRDLHKAIKLCEKMLLTSKPINSSLGHSQEAEVYEDESGACAAFLANTDDKNDVTVTFRNSSYHLPAWSVSILPDCKNEVYNTAKVQLHIIQNNVQVTSQATVVKMVSEKLRPSVQSSKKDSDSPNWEVFVEKAGIWGEADLVKNGLDDHINTTKDASDYLWYTTSFTCGEDEAFLKQGKSPVLMIDSKGHALHVFINGELQGSASGNGTVFPFKYKKPITLKAGKNEISLLSITVGLPTAGPRYEWIPAGLTYVKIQGLNNGTVDLSKNQWTYKIGLQGEKLAIYTPSGMSHVSWNPTPNVPKMQPLTWYKTVLEPPTGNEPIGLDMLNMGKGLAWLNGEEIGRYWPRKSPKNGKCVDECDYRGKFMPDKCLTGCGKPTQRWYHVPRSWFKPSGNVLVIFEEKGGDPTKIKFSKRRTSGVCASVSEDYPSSYIHLKCPEDTHISTVKFASFGSPKGVCGSYKISDCHDPNSISSVEKECLKKNECSIEVSEEKFMSKGSCKDGANMKKQLAVEVECSS